MLYVALFAVDFRSVSRPVVVNFALTLHDVALNVLIIQVGLYGLRPHWHAYHGDVDFSRYADENKNMCMQRSRSLPMPRFYCHRVTCHMSPVMLLAPSKDCQPDSEYIPCSGL